VKTTFIAFAEVVDVPMPLYTASNYIM
jgi:hypothetical protein